MKFTNSAGQTISFAQAAFAMTVYLIVGSIGLFLGWVALVFLFGIGPV